MDVVVGPESIWKISVETLIGNVLKQPLKSKCGKNNLKLPCIRYTYGVGLHSAKFLSFRTLCDCAKIAKENGYKGYGIVFYGECWGYSEPLKTIQRSGCINTQYEKCTYNDQVCVGDNQSAFVYMFHDTVKHWKLKILWKTIVCTKLHRSSLNDYYDSSEVFYNKIL